MATLTRFRGALRQICVKTDGGWSCRHCWCVKDGGVFAQIWSRCVCEVKCRMRWRGAWFVFSGEVLQMQWFFFSDLVRAGAEKWTRMRVARGGGVRWWCSLLQRWLCKQWRREVALLQREDDRGAKVETFSGELTVADVVRTKRCGGVRDGAAPNSGEIGG
ncbi:hypothetical protein DEO72_LG11g1959 [Vigna unguiculata]|uniref:Uncharacterized protein n=1 Tax=Vigna unguiculata TaxID=3917 RepID=A0A4D6NPN2_VIGUN|nr:hypothetical protein DEO72_LG11g1959 [Vigna unguiculata]